MKGITFDYYLILFNLMDTNQNIRLCINTFCINDKSSNSTKAVSYVVTKNNIKYYFKC